MANSEDVLDDIDVIALQNGVGPLERELIYRLAAEVRELRRDRARLDWLEANGPEAIAGSGDELAWLVEWWEDGKRLMQTEADHLRDAIDAAMDGGEGEA